MNADEIDQGIEYPRFFLQHGIAPILMGQIPKGVRPVCGQAERPKGNCGKKQDTECGQPPSPSEGKKDHGRLYAPVRVVDRSVGKDQAEKEDHRRCHHVRNQ